MPLSFIAALALFADSATFVPRPAEPLQEAEKQRIEALVQTLGSATAKERRGARKAIAELDPKTHSLLRQFMEKATDVEIKEALRELLAAHEFTVPWKALSPAEQKFIQDLHFEKSRYNFSIALHQKGSLAICQIQDHLLIIPDAKLAAKCSGYYGRSEKSSTWNDCKSTETGDGNVVTFNSSNLIFNCNEAGKSVAAFGLNFDLNKAQTHLFNPDGSYRGRLVDKP